MPQQAMSGNTALQQLTQGNLIMSDPSYQPKTYRKQGGNEFVIDNGGTLTIASGGTINVANGASVSGFSSVASFSATSETLTGTDESAVVVEQIGKCTSINRWHKTITLATDGATTSVGLTPAGIVLSVALRVSTAIAGLDSADHHIQCGVSGTLTKYIDKANGSSATSIAKNKKDHYYGASAETAALVLTITGGSDVTPSSGAVEIEVVYISVSDLADG